MCGQGVEGGREKGQEKGKTDKAREEGKKEVGRKEKDRGKEGRGEGREERGALKVTVHAWLFRQAYIHHREVRITHFCGLSKSLPSVVNSFGTQPFSLLRILSVVNINPFCLILSPLTLVLSLEEMNS